MRRMLSRSVACRAYTRKAVATAPSSITVNGNTSLAPIDQKNPPTDRDNPLRRTNIQPSWLGVTEQFRRSIQCISVRDAVPRRGCFPVFITLRPREQPCLTQRRDRVRQETYPEQFDLCQL